MEHQALPLHELVYLMKYSDDGKKCSSHGRKPASRRSGKRHPGLGQQIHGSKSWPAQLFLGYTAHFTSQIEKSTICRWYNQTFCLTTRFSTATAKKIRSIFKPASLCPLSTRPTTMFSMLMVRPSLIGRVKINEICKNKHCFCNRSGY